MKNLFQTVLLAIVLLGSAAQAGVTYYKLGDAPYYPPYPDNPCPDGILVSSSATVVQTPAGPITNTVYYVDDALVTGLRSRMMTVDESDDGPPGVPGGGDNGNYTEPVEDYTGTWILGCQVHNPNGYPWTPYAWQVNCNQQGGNPSVHVPQWTGWTRVCPGDGLGVVWPMDILTVATFPIDCFLLQQRFWNGNHTAILTNNIRCQMAGRIGRSLGPGAL